MIAFLLSGTLGFIIYQSLAWAKFPSQRRVFDVGDIKIRFSASVAAWARRTLRSVVTILIVGVIVLLTRPFPSSDAVSAAVLLGAFWGPLFGIWINAVIKIRPGRNLNRGQLIAGFGLSLVFLIGSFGNEAGSLIREYSKRISNFKFGGAEFSFSDRSKAGSPGPGALPDYGKTLVSGSAGLFYLADLDEMIRRNERYLDVFSQIELRNNYQIRRLEWVVDDARRKRLLAASASNRRQWEIVKGRLDTAMGFAKAVTKPMECLVGWYAATGDTLSVNDHLKSYGMLVRRVSATDSKQQIDEIADGLVGLLIEMASDIVTSIPKIRIKDRCDDLLQRFCPNELANWNRQPLRACLDDAREAAKKPLGSSADRVKEFRLFVAEGLKKFIDTDGADNRPYFVVAYASILTQLQEYKAAGAILDEWLQRRRIFEANRPRRALAEDWFDIRARSMLIIYTEEWVRTFGSQPPSNILDEHIRNLDVVLNYLEPRLSKIHPLKTVLSAAEEQAETQRISFRRPEQSKCEHADGDFDDVWSRLFETYVSFRLTRVQAKLLHFDYRESAERTTEEVRKLINIDLSCISNPIEARTYAAQIVEAFVRNAIILTELRGTADGEDTIRTRIAEAIDVAKFGLELLKEARKKDEEKKNEEARIDESLGTNRRFLDRISTGDIAATQEKLRANTRWLEKAQQNLR